MIYGVGLTTYCVLVLLYRDSFNYECSQLFKGNLRHRFETVDCEDGK